jgi:hypothetical protein
MGYVRGGGWLVGVFFGFAAGGFMADGPAVEFVNSS